MQTFNYHAHTFRCQHAYGSEEEYIRAAIKAGYKVFGFSEHAPLWRKDNQRMRMDYSAMDEYISTIHALNDRYKDTIAIPCGIEADSYLCSSPIMDEFFEKLDYVILSVHGLDENHPFYFAHEKSQEDILLYGKIVEEVLPQRKWLYLAHPDYFMRKETQWTDECEETAHRICAAACKNNTIMEMNLTGMYTNRIHYPDGLFYYYPNMHFWKVAQQYPVKVVFGLDAHESNVIADTSYMEQAEKEFGSLNLEFVKKPLI